MALKFKETTTHRKRSQPPEGLFAKSKSKLLRKGKSKMTTQESEPMHKQEEVSAKKVSGAKKKTRKKSKKEAFPIHREVTVKGETMQIFSKAKSTGALEFKGSDTFGAGMVSGTIHGDKGGRGLTGKVATSRAGTRSLGNQEDKKNSDTQREAKGRKYARKRTEAKVDKNVRKQNSKKNQTTGNPSSKVGSGRKMTNKVTEVVSRFKRSKNAKR